VDVKPSPFVCRGRQFMLSGPTWDASNATRIRGMIRKKIIGDQIQGVRDLDGAKAQAYVQKQHDRDVKTHKEQHSKLSKRLKNLEQQHDTLKMILVQIELDKKIKAENSAMGAHDKIIVDASKDEPNVVSNSIEGAVVLNDTPPGVEKADTDSMEVDANGKQKPNDFVEEEPETKRTKE